MARILLVDDEDTLRGFLKRGLELDGHSVVTAIDGSDGSTACPRPAAAST